MRGGVSFSCVYCLTFGLSFAYRGYVRGRCVFVRVRRTFVAYIAFVCGLNLCGLGLCVVRFCCVVVPSSH